ncbi:YebC/PmpR family DNA-binding transcriptional regulator [Candidatus Microgenomates bacterium]|nr:YebC/PmpR family DNA-binding transcriptional regulator [Candidatus Microgenomates bacterium]
MSGHSKWATIKRDKGANDAKRGAVFTKLANAITMAVRQGGGNADPTFNFKLRLAIDKAKQANMPKDNISRAIDKGSGKGDGVQLTEAVFEGFGPGGTAIMIEAISDNTTRTAQMIRSIFVKNDCNLGTPGSVSYLFTRLGEIENVTFEEALQVDALDFDENTLYTKPEDLHRVSETLKKPGSLVFRPNKETMVEIKDPVISGKIQDLLEAIDELDDVQNVYINA